MGALIREWSGQNLRCFDRGEGLRARFEFSAPLFRDEHIDGPEEEEKDQGQESESGEESDEFD